MVSSVSANLSSQLLNQLSSSQSNKQQGGSQLDAVLNNQGGGQHAQQKPKVNTQGQLTGTIVNVKA
jgi:hypothetical protein